MSGYLHIIFAPLLPDWIFAALAIAAAVVLILSTRRNARGWMWRCGFFALLLLALANPSLIAEQHEPLKDTALIVLDDSASMKIGDRAAQADAALDALTKKLATFPDLDTVTLRVKGANETDLFNEIGHKLASIPRDRLAGVIAITDGQIHDKLESALTAPFHALVAGHKDEMDRRIIVKEAPAYGLVGKSVALTLRIEDEPSDQSKMANVTFQRGNGETSTMAMPVGKDVSFNMPVDHAGSNLFAFSVEAAPKELTTINNSAAVTVNGIRDRLRVLLVSGEPHIGGRTWRNFLKADPAVDLIHFTILRSPTKFSMTPNSEMSLIAFPVQELFEAKLQSFDLVIFDCFHPQSLVPDAYLENIAKYVEKGGALLVSSSTEDGFPSLTFSPLQRVLPAEPTGKLLTQAFKPDLTDAGLRHPVTAGLIDAAPPEKWGSWFRQIDARAAKGDVLMKGANGAPLLVLNHVGDGRVAEFLSDQFWLWARNFEGGGPQAELLRRVAHWLVQEPELDEAALRAHGEATDDGWQLVITKQSLRENNAKVTVTGPDGSTNEATLAPTKQAGILGATVPVKDAGLYHLKDGVTEVLAMVGPSDAPEFGAMIATDKILAPIVKSTGGKIDWLQDNAGGPDIRRTSSHGPQAGWNWIGLKQNGQYRVTGSKAYPLLPPWLLVLLLLGTGMMAWRREGK